jgi:hypothetical protein
MRRPQASPTHGASTNSHCAGRNVDSWWLIVAQIIIIVEAAVAMVGEDARTAPL